MFLVVKLRIEQIKNEYIAAFYVPSPLGSGEQIELGCSRKAVGPTNRACIGCKPCQSKEKCVLGFLFQTRPSLSYAVIATSFSHPRNSKV